ncbi:hypothetical protein LCGC14_0579620 [marine sediment metagenome]|uniref:Uncharacterized protein n=1 Tax=marine sediment metagenome TaxID=412755 RepID=A0A0F9RGM6_9ZZZZ
MTLKNITEAKQEDVKELWLWEYFGGKDRKISDNQFHLKKHIEENFKNEEEITYNLTSRGIIVVYQGLIELGVIKKVDVI